MKPHLCHVTPSFGTGGPEVRTALIIDASMDEFRHTVISINGDLSGRRRIESRGEVLFPSVRRTGRRARDLGGLAHTLRELRPDLLLTYGWGGTDGLVAARFCGIRRVLHAEDGFLPDEATRQCPRRLLARRVLLRVPARVVCPSRTLVRIARQSWRLPERKIRYIPNGVDRGRFIAGSRDDAVVARRALDLADEEFVVGSVGRLGAEKNHARLLRAFATVAAVRPARLLLVGDGPSRADLESLAGNLGIGDRVIFAGTVADPVAHYRAMDLFALPSDTEQMPIAVLEAMSMALPIVSTDVGDVRLMVSPENLDYVVSASRDEDFASAIGRLAADRGARHRLGLANQRACVRYGLDAMIREYMELYRELLREAGRP